MPVGNRKHIPRDRKELMVSLSAQYKPSDIARICDVTTRTVRRVLALWMRTGDVVQTPDVQGRPRKLNNMDIAVGCLSLRCCPLCLTGA